MTAESRVQAEGKRFDVGVTRGQEICRILDNEMDNEKLLQEISTVDAGFCCTTVNNDREKLY